MPWIRFYPESQAGWISLQDLPNNAFVCGYCTTRVSSIRGYRLENVHKAKIGAVYICPNCGGPVFLIQQKGNIPFSSARCFRPAHSGTVGYTLRRSQTLHGTELFYGNGLVCRKILMHIAVEKLVKENLNFFEYVSYLSDHGYVPPDGKHWVDHIRRKGNDGEIRELPSVPRERAEIDGNRANWRRLRVGNRALVRCFFPRERTGN